MKKQKQLGEAKSYESIEAKRKRAEAAAKHREHMSNEARAALDAWTESTYIQRKNEIHDAKRVQRCLDNFLTIIEGV